MGKITRAGLYRKCIYLYASIWAGRAQSLSRSSAIVATRARTYTLDAALLSTTAWMIRFASGPSLNSQKLGGIPARQNPKRFPIQRNSEANCNAVYKLQASRLLERPRGNDEMKMKIKWKKIKFKDSGSLWSMTNRLTKNETGEEIWIRIRSERALPHTRCRYNHESSCPDQQRKLLGCIDADFCKQAFQICQSRRKELDYVLYEYIFAELRQPGVRMLPICNQKCRRLR